MSATATLMTVEEFANMRTADTEAYELVEGELIPLPSATPLHAKIRRRLERLIEDYFERNPIGDVFSETDCRSEGRTIRRPDVAVFIGERSKQIDLQIVPVPFAPDIAVEILSPSESAIEVHRKAIEYLAGGSSEVWILDHANAELEIRTASGIRLLRSADIIDTPRLPGFSFTLPGLLAGFQDHFTGTSAR